MVLEGGTLTSSAGSRGCPHYGLLRLRTGWVWNGVGGVEPVVGTLLGPEGTGHPGLFAGGGRCFGSGPSCSPYRDMPAGVFGRRGRVGGVWSYVENCTVDASIFLTLVV